jgi:ribose transport system substrate-binding protein
MIRSRKLLAPGLAVGLVASALGFAPLGVGAADEEMMTCPDGTKVAALVHFQGPFTQEILTGATTAAEECGAEIATQGPAAFEAQASLAQFNDVIAAGAEAVSVTAFPADFWVRPIDDAVAQGVVVNTWDVPSTASLQSLHVAPKEQDLGVALAEAMAAAIGGSEAEGSIVMGLCIPGLDVLEKRVDGFRRRMGELSPNVELLGSFDVSFDQTENLARWTDLINNNPDAVGHVGFCENDLPSLIRVKERDPDATYEIASVGISPEILEGVANGTALAAVGQKPFMMGYVSMRSMLESIVNGTEMPRGWIDVGVEVVTAENAQAVADREATLADGPDGSLAYFQPEIDAIFADLPAAVQSFGAFLEP